MNAHHAASEPTGHHGIRAVSDADGGSGRDNSLAAPYRLCVNGHAMTPANTGIQKRRGRADNEFCRTCNREASKLAWVKRKARERAKR